MLWLRAKSSGNGVLENTIHHFIDLDNLDDDHIDQIQDIIENGEEISDDDEEIFPRNMVLPNPQTSKIEPSFMDA